MNNKLFTDHNLPMALRIKHMGTEIIKVIYALYLIRGSYMIAHVLLNLSNELGKRDRM